MRSKYKVTHSTIDKVFIVDMNEPDSKSVTNDAENVWGEIQLFYPGTRLIYRDTLGRWDEIVFENDTIGFKPYCEYLPLEAKGF